MPSNKSLRSSNSSRASMLAMPMRSVTNLFSTVSSNRVFQDSLGQPVKEAPATADATDRDESFASPLVQRRKSRLNVLTSFFSPTSLGGPTDKSSATTNVNPRPKTSHELLSHHIREQPIHRKPVASAVEFNHKSSSEESPNTSNHHNSISTIDNSSGVLDFNIPTPATENSDLDFGFGVEPTASPEAIDNSPPQGQSEGQDGADMPALIQKQPKAPTERPPPPPRKDTALQNAQYAQAPATPASLAHSVSGGSEAGSVSPKYPPSSSAKHDGRARLQSTRRPSSQAAPRVRSSSAQPPGRRSTGDHARTVSTPLDPRPTSRQSNDGDARGRLRRSWLPGARRSESKDSKMSGNKAWIIASGNHADYNTSFLMNGDKVPELWNENGDVLVHLFPKHTGKGASFKVPAYSIEASIVFHELMQAELESSRNGRVRGQSFNGRDNLVPEDATRQPQMYAAPETAPDEVRLYLPAPYSSHGGVHDDTSKPDVDRFIAVRNLFAFLTGQPLVGTKKHPTIFSAFLEISDLLKEFDFMSMDGTTWGEAVDMSFGFYITQMALADVRQSREKTLEAVILGERMKSWDLYNEAYTHATGKWQAIVALKSPLMKQVSPLILHRLERANLDLLNRQHNVNLRLEAFEFPALFAGVAGSSEFKDIKFNRWKTAFSKMRGFTLEYYKDMFGSWPPKARSKKNPFSESGLNRLVLKALYADLCTLYDLLVDRDSLTPRVIDQAPEDVPDKEQDQHIQVLRKILTEFDQSEPPVLPPIPFDIPRLPTMKTVLANYDEMKEKERAKFDRKLKEHERQLVLHKSYNFDTDTIKTPFLAHFKDFDSELNKGKNSAEMVDFRMGIWLFLYVVIQSLPMLVIDAPDLQFTEGVEYFLCQPPMGNAPWIEDAGATRKAWYQIPGSEVKVELSADVVMFSVEGTYERSHCWEVAKRWDEAKMNGGSADLLGLPPHLGAGGQPLTNPAADAIMPLSPLAPPAGVFEDMDPSRGYVSGTASSNGGGSPGSSAPGSPAHASQRRSIAPGSGLAQGRGAGSNYRASFAGLAALEMLEAPLAIPVDRRSTRVLSSRSDSLTPRPESSGGVGSMRSDSPARRTNGAREPSHDRNGSSTFDDILKDMSGQKQNAKPAKKGKFGF